MPKMPPLQARICDTCGEEMDIEEGWVEWIDTGDGGSDSFRICHNDDGCQQHTSKDGCSDNHLKYFLGVDGLQCLLSKLDVGPLLDPRNSHNPHPPEMRPYVDVIRRLQIPYYEEARRYFSAALADGWFSDQNEMSIFRPDTCKAIIERYE